MTQKGVNGKSYRYMGAGKACAGQSKAMLEDSLNWKPLVVIALANLGGTRPTGSAHVGRRNHGLATPEIGLEWNDRPYSPLHFS